MFWLCTNQLTSQRNITYANIIIILNQALFILTHRLSKGVVPENSGLRVRLLCDMNRDDHR